MLYTIKLIGGPSSVTAEMRVRTVKELDAVVKLPHRNGYEHFAYSGSDDVDDDGVHPRFCWVGRTLIAE